MSIFMLKENVGYEGEKPIGLFDSFDKAHDYWKRLDKSCFFNTAIEEWPINEFLPKVTTVLFHEHTWR